MRRRKSLNVERSVCERPSEHFLVSCSLAGIDQCSPHICGVGYIGVGSGSQQAAAKSSV